MSLEIQNHSTYTHPVVRLHELLNQFRHDLSVFEPTDSLSPKQKITAFKEVHAYGEYTNRIQIYHSLVLERMMDRSAREMVHDMHFRFSDWLHHLWVTMRSYEQFRYEGLKIVREYIDTLEALVHFGKI